MVIGIELCFLSWDYPYMITVAYIGCLNIVWGFLTKISNELVCANHLLINSEPTKRIPDYWNFSVNYILRVIMFIQLAAQHIINVKVTLSINCVILLIWDGCKVYI
jgi:hypothetical protein